MILFWTHGFGSLGTREIEEKTGITRFTLQKSYGGKMKLFLAALDAYLELFERSDMMTRPAAGLDSLAYFFEACSDPVTMPEASCQGCLMLNSMVEFSNRDPDINHRTERYFGLLRKRFQSELEHPQQNGSLGTQRPIDELTETLLGGILGFNTIIRAKADNAADSHMAASIAGMIRSWDAQ